VTTKERLAAMAGSLCAVCTGVMVIKVGAPDPRDGAMQLRTYVCAVCGHSRTYSVDGGESWWAISLKMPLKEIGVIA
jgi:hypothetical protein